jgi:hypothetical protein
VAPVVCAGVDIRAPSAAACAARGTGPFTTTFADRPLIGRPVTAGLTETPGVPASAATALPTTPSISTPARAGAAGIAAGGPADGATTEGLAGFTAAAGAAPFEGGVDDAGAAAGGGACTTAGGAA